MRAASADIQSVNFAMFSEILLIRPRQPLMNAASKGQLPVLRYFLAKHSPDPFIRNTYNETAYDVAVATYELGIADALASYESRIWQDKFATSKGRYNSLAVHTDVPVIIHENQKLDTGLEVAMETKARFKQSDRLRQSPDFTSTALSGHYTHAPVKRSPIFEGIHPTQQHVPFRKLEVALPSRNAPFILILPAEQSTFSRTLRCNVSESTSGSSASETSEDPAWYWLSRSFFVDLSPASVDPEQGWQYAPSFDVADDQWTADPPNDLAAILDGGTCPSTCHWVRRRRWAKIMRRRLDVPFFGFADLPKGGVRDAKDESSASEDDLKERELARTRDYIERAKYFAGSHLGISKKNRYAFTKDNIGEDEDDRSIRSQRTIFSGSANASRLDRGSQRRIVSRLERAVDELKCGLKCKWLVLLRKSQEMTGTYSGS